jgi:hypothetical protein
MNNKLKKLFSILILIVVVVSSFTYYEYATEPQGLQGICNGEHSVNYSSNKNYNILGTSYLYSDNVSYLGNKADLMLWIWPQYNIFNLSSCNFTNNDGSGVQLLYTALFINNESYAYPYSHLVISVTNFSIAFNKTMFYNVSTNKGDVFGNYIQSSGDFTGNCPIYGTNLWEPPYLKGIPLTKVIIPGNYTLYENITFTITVSLGIIHFTSQQYSIHKSLWELWGYNDVRGGGPIGII